MRHIKSLDYGKRFQLNGGCVQMVEQTYASAEQDGRQIDLYFIQQPCLETLLCDTGANHIDVLIPRGILRLPDGAFHAVRDEGEWRPRLNPFLRNRVGHDEMRRIRSTRRISSPPARDVEGPPSRDRGSDIHPGR